MNFPFCDAELQIIDVRLLPVTCADYFTDLVNLSDFFPFASEFYVYNSSTV